jgi:hypothetical protein
MSTPVARPSVEVDEPHQSRTRSSTRSESSNIDTSLPSLSDSEKSPPASQFDSAANELSSSLPEKVDLTVTSLARHKAVGDKTLEKQAPAAPQLKDIFFRRSKGAAADLDAIATQASVLDDLHLAPHYWPSTKWENYDNWDVTLRWTRREERQVVRIIDRKVLLWICLFFAILNLDRGNLSAANSDGILKDLNLSTNVSACVGLVYVIRSMLTLHDRYHRTSTLRKCSSASHF